jgi:peptide/nickel transport system ATP-binding protein
MAAPMLQVNDIVKRFGGARAAPAVDGISLELAAGSTLGIVGESGSGKSTVARIIAGLLPADSGSVSLDGINLSSGPIAPRSALRREIQMVFQDSASSLNPRLTLVRSIALQAMAQGMRESQARQQAGELLEQVGLPPGVYADRYPHQLSGGQRQRVNIARALITRPRLLILDEPVSALDKTIEAQIIDLLARLQRELGLSYLFISHDLEITRMLCRQVLVMYRGRIAEVGDSRAVFDQPQHPYTALLLAARLGADPGQRRLQDFDASGDAGSGLSGSDAITASTCAFAPRCPHADGACSAQRPHLRVTDGGRLSACLQARAGRHLLSQRHWS